MLLLLLPFLFFFFFFFLFLLEFYYKKKKKKKKKTDQSSTATAGAASNACLVARISDRPVGVGDAAATEAHVFHGALAHDATTWNTDQVVKIQTI